MASLFDGLGLRKRFVILLGIFVAGFAIFGLWSFKTLSELQVNGSLFQRIVQNKDLVADILPPPAYIFESYLTVLQTRARRRARGWPKPGVRGGAQSAGAPVRAQCHPRCCGH
jgi:hypothetical protein